MAFSLSPKQAKVKAYIIEYMDRNDGQCPTYAEMAAGCGFASDTSAKLLVKALVERGHAEVIPGKWRAIRIVPDAVSPPHGGA